MKFLNFFLLLWVIFALLDPDQDSEYGSGSTDPIEYGSNSDPDSIRSVDPDPNWESGSGSRRTKKWPTKVEKI